jgi:uncharacterized membrane protein YfcA
MMEWWPAYLIIGVLAGFLAGLLGIGGGALIVPLLVFVFTAQGFPPEHLLHVALGTAMASIVFTSLSSMRAHDAHGAVDWRIARALAPGLLAGSFGAALLAGLIPTRPLAMLFTALVVFVGTQLLLDLKPRNTRELPASAGLFLAGTVIGGVSSLAAAGGAFLAIPFLAWCNVPLRRAIGTASATGFPIAVAGSAGYIAQGWRVAGLPEASLGYVHLPALGAVAMMSMLAAPFGARLAHRMPVKRLRMVFALMFYALAVRMLAGLL